MTNDQLRDAIEDAFTMAQASSDEQVRRHLHLLLAEQQRRAQRGTPE